MKIGIDFDNTIVLYDSLFRKVAQKEGLLEDGWLGSTKTEIRNYLCNQPEGEKNWMKLQGLIYGKYMKDAEMMPGAANFLMSCNIRNHQVFIVSHKTEYGHFDPEKISLRSEAVKWMEARRFFDPVYFGLHRENVFFSNTRAEKVNIISQLHCDWFIDDLPAVFDEKHFPISSKKILFGDFNLNQYQDRVVLNSWRKISDKTIGQITDRDVAFWVRSMINNSVEQVEKIQGCGGNSVIYRICVSRGKSYALKYYPDRLMDNRPRLVTEFNALEILREKGLKNIPQPIERNDDLNLGLYQWIEGKKVTKPTIADLGRAVNFAEKLVALSKDIDSNMVGIASEACLSAYELFHQIEKRLFRLEKISLEHQDLFLFLNDVFTPLFNNVKDENIGLWPEESRQENLPKEKQILSPSDFGFHNCLKATDGSLTFLDFDYFGWDDPVKLTADFIWHPAMNLNIELKDEWKSTMLKMFSADPYFEERLNAAIPLYGLRWALIVLNEFFPELAQKRKDADGSKKYDLQRVQKIQLEIANQYCEKIKHMFSQYSFA